MKNILLAVLTVVIFQVTLASKLDEQCESWAKKTVSINSCCKIVPIFPNDIKNLTLDDIPKNVSENSTIYYCHLIQKYFEKTNISTFDQSSMKNYLEKFVTDQDWISIMKNASDHCVESGLKHAESDQSELNVPKEECDARFLYFFNCLVSYTKMFCPSKGFISSDKCLETKRFLDLCGSSEKALTIYAEKHNDD